jgi:hypothetical protein
MLNLDESWPGLRSSKPSYFTMRSTFKDGHFRMSGAVFFMAVALLLMRSLLARELEQSSDAGISILDETTKRLNTADNFCTVQWLPTEYWRREPELNLRETPDTIQALVETIGRYTVFLVLDAKKAPLGVFDYTPAERLRSTATMVSPSGDMFTPLDEDALVPGARNLFSVWKPLFSNMFGSMGKHFEFLIFPGKDKSGAKVVDPLGMGTLTINVNSHSFAWRLPLGSLLPQKSCPTCGQTFPGNYEFCPYDGTKLAERSPYKTTTSDIPRVQPPLPQRLMQQKSNTGQSAPTPKTSDDQIRAQNEKAFQRLMQQKSNTGQSAPIPKMSDDQIRAQNEKVFERLGISPTPPSP